MKKEKIVASNPTEDWKGFVRMLCKMNVLNTSEEIANVINNNSNNNVTKMMVAGVKASVKKGM